GFADIFVYDRQTNTTDRVSVSSTGTQANERSFFPSLSADGRYVAFLSDANNLLPNGNSQDVYVFDRQSRTIERVNQGLSGAAPNSISNELSMTADARFVTFVSNASNLVAGDTNGFQD